MTYTAKHRPCGHWHKMGSISTSVPITNLPLWQQALSVLKANSFLAISGMEYADSPAIAYDYITGGHNYASGSHLFGRTWTQTSELDGVLGPTIAKTVSGFPTTLYANTNNGTEIFFCFHNINLSYSNIVYTLTSPVTNIGRDIAMCANSSGTIVIGQMFTVSGGNKFCTFVSTDWGYSWSSINIASSESNGTMLKGIAIGPDNKFYVVLQKWGATAVPFKLYSSSDGVTWSAVLGIPTTPAYNMYDLNICVSGSRMYICGTDSSNNYLWYTDNLWSSYTAVTVSISGLVTQYDLFMAVSGSTIVLIATDNGDSVTRILRSVDAGANWSVIGQVNPPSTWPTFVGLDNINIGSISIDDSVIAFTCCGAYIDGTNYLGYLLSTDEGVTWEAKTLPYSRIAGPTY